jgi:acetyltransferase-like isoleucine patch superfamily enzyme
MTEAKAPRIHPTALIESGAQLAEDVCVGAYSIIHAAAEIEAGTVVGAHCEIGHPAHDPAHAGPLRIGANSLIRSHSVFYEGSQFGAGLVTGHRVTVREGMRVGQQCKIGTQSDLQGHARIGDHVRLHSNVFLAQSSTLHDCVWLFPHVLVTDDPHPPSHTRLGVVIHAFAAIGARSVLLPGVQLGSGCVVAAGSTVTRDVPAETVVVGVPARFHCMARDVLLRNDPGAPAYPWRHHFHQGYPAELVASWLGDPGEPMG